MRPSLPTRTPRVSLTVSSPTEPPLDPAPSGRVPYLPWVVAAIAWSLGALLVGWLLVGVPASLAWLTAVRTPLTAVLATIGQGWLSLHGVPVVLGGVHLGVTPLGLTAVVVAACATAAHHAARQVTLAPDAPARERWLAAAWVVGACTGTYTLAALVLASLVGTPDQALGVLPGAVLVSFCGAAAGVSLGLSLAPLAGLPGWVRALPGAAAVGLGALAVGSLAALVVGFVAHSDRVAALHGALTSDAAGSALLVLAQLAWWPNLLAWSGAWVLGAGTILGAGTVVAPGLLTGGLVPPVPVFGVVPEANPLDWAWLSVGVAAGAASGWWLVRTLRAHGAAPRLATWPWQAALAGLASGLGWIALSWLSRGDLGTGRLTGLGPRFPELLLFATLPLAAAAALAGLALALIHRPRPAEGPPDPAEGPPDLAEGPPSGTDAPDEPAR